MNHDATLQAPFHASAKPEHMNNTHLAFHYKQQAAAGIYDAPTF
jgi:hypothetical protein